MPIFDQTLLDAAGVALAAAEADNATAEGYGTVNSCEARTLDAQTELLEAIAKILEAMNAAQTP